MTESISAEQYQELMRGKGGGNKYGAKQTIVDGIRFASRAEASRYGELRLMERAGAIRDLERQPRFDIIINGIKCGHYSADFRYLDVERGTVTTEDVKGGKATRTEAYRLRKRIVEALYGITITEVER